MWAYLSLRHGLPSLPLSDLKGGWLKERRRTRWGDRAEPT
jgi:hypothetical protein